MLNLAWTTEATSEFEALLEYIAQRNVGAAHRLETLIHDRVETVRKFPESGRRGRVSGTRELVPHPNYIVIYRADDKILTVLSVLHARRRYP